MDDSQHGEWSCPAYMLLLGWLHPVASRDVPPFGWTPPGRPKAISWGSTLPRCPRDVDLCKPGSGLFTSNCMLAARERLDSELLR